MISKLLVATLLISFALAGCTNYEDGDFFDLSSASKKIVGTWEIEYLYVDGIDSTIYALNQSCNPRIQLILDEEHKTSGFIIPTDADFACKKYYGNWQFGWKKKTLRLVTNYLPGNTYTPIGAYLQNGIVDWKINKLRKDQLWLQTNQHYYYLNNITISHHTWIHLKKID